MNNSVISGTWLPRTLLWSFLLFYCVVLFALDRHLVAKAARPDPETRVSVEHSGRFGDTPPYIVLKRGGVSEPVLSEVIAALKKEVPPRSINAKDTYTVVLSTSGVFRTFRVHYGGRKVVYVARLNSGKLAHAQMDMEVRSSRKTAFGRIKGSLWDSMLASGGSPALVMEFADAFAWNIDFLTETNDRDVYAMIWDEKSTSERVVGRQLLAVYYKGSAVGEKYAFYHDGEYYDEKGACLKRMFLRAPLQYKRISSYFTNRRYHPVLRIFRAHHAIDYAAPTGTPVSAIGEGTVRFAGWKGGLGNYVEISHPQSYATGYGHMNRIASNVRRGSRVHQGQVIGYVGSTGMSTGPHLDFRFLQNGTPLNFLKTKARSVSKSVSKKDLSGFVENAKQLRRQLEQSVAKL